MWQILYRGWSHNGDTTEASQVEQIEKFTTQIDEANACFEKIIITGDINLCSNKWAEISYIRKNISRPLLECLNQHGMSLADIGTTYQADHILNNGTIPESALDHVYIIFETLVFAMEVLNFFLAHSVLPVLR